MNLIQRGTPTKSPYPDWRYLEHGKYFANGGASDFYELAYTRDMAGHSGSLTDVLRFPEGTRFASKTGNISAAFLPISPTEFVFAHVQRRRENELEPESSMARWFNQVRFTLLRVQDVHSLLETGKPLFYDLVYQHPAGLYANNKKNDKDKDKPLLPDYYTIVGRQEARDMYPAKRPIVNPCCYLYDLQQGRLTQEIQQQIRTIAQAVVESQGRSDHVWVYCSDLSFAEKLLLAQAIQRLVYPLVGPLSFALDYVTDPLRPVRLQFISDRQEQIQPRAQPIVVDLEHLNSLDSRSYAWHALNLFSEKRVDWFVANKGLFDELARLILIRTHDHAEAFRVAAELHENYFKYVKNLCAYRGWFTAGEFCSRIKPPYAPTPKDGEKTEVLEHFGLCILDGLLACASLEEWLKTFFETPADQPDYLDLLLKALSRHEKEAGTLETAATILARHIPAWRNLLEHPRQGWKSALAQAENEEGVRLLIAVWLRILGQDLGFSEWFLFYEWRAFFEARPPEVPMAYQRLVEALTQIENRLIGHDRLAFLLHPEDYPELSFVQVWGDGSVLFDCAVRYCLTQRRPLPLPDVAWIIKKAIDRYRELLLHLLNLVTDDRYADMDEDLVLKLLNDVKINDRLPLYNLAHAQQSNASPPSLPFIERTLREILVLPLNHEDKVNRYRSWMEQVRRWTAGQSPHLDRLAGRESAIVSYWEAAQCVTPDPDLFLIALDYALPDLPPK